MEAQFLMKPANTLKLGINGLGRIGKLVAQRALAFGMNLIAYDPFVSADRARELSVELVCQQRRDAQRFVPFRRSARQPAPAGGKAGTRVR